MEGEQVQVKQYIWKWNPGLTQKSTDGNSDIRTYIQNAISKAIIVRLLEKESIDERRNILKQRKTDYRH